MQESDMMGKYGPDLAISNDLMRKLLQEEKGSQELKIYADQKESYFNKDVFNVTNQETLIGRVIVLRNITPFHELNEAKTNFIATVSHELKTPIASIKMGASLLLNEKTGTCNPEQKELVKSILEDSNRLLKITGELLNISQVETGNLQLKLQEFNPAVILETAIKTVQFQAQQKQLVIIQNKDSSKRMAFGDSEKTTWVLNNLLTNAIKYSTEQSDIEIGFSVLETSIRFFVKDQGRGIEPKYLPRIFEKYFKVPGTIDRTGTGLGLAISKEFIEAQQGTIWVESSIGEGSVFQFTLPIAK
jgi:signal transduction histidine kinase